MSRYGAIAVVVWTSLKIRRASSDARVVWFYLLTSEHPIPGVVVGGPATHAERLEWTTDRFRGALAELEQLGFRIRVDLEGRLVWLPNAVKKYQPPSNASQILAWARAWDTVPESPVKAELLEALREVCAPFEGKALNQRRGAVLAPFDKLFGVASRAVRGVPEDPPQAGPRGVLGGGQGVCEDQDQDQDQDREALSVAVPDPRDPDALRDDVRDLVGRAVDCATAAPAAGDDRDPRSSLIAAIVARHVEAHEALRVELDDPVSRLRSPTVERAVASALAAYKDIEAAARDCEVVLTSGIAEARRRHADGEVPALKFFNEGAWRRMAKTLELAVAGARRGPVRAEDARPAISKFVPDPPIPAELRATTEDARAARLALGFEAEAKAS